MQIWPITQDRFRSIFDCEDSILDVNIFYCGRFISKSSVHHILRIAKYIVKPQVSIAFDFRDSIC